MASEAFFLPAASGQRFCLLHAPAVAVPAPAALVFVHAFAEEMNKSRRMAALQARALALAGHWVLQIDLLGCGDSSGDFADATWAAWLEDIETACRYLESRTDAPLWLWGHRVGCLLAAAAGVRRPVNFLFWQPVASGAQFLQQFLRLKLAGAWAGGDGKGLMDRLRGQLASGRSLEIGGYTLSAALAHALEMASLPPPLPFAEARRMEWLEVTSRAECTLSPAAGKHLDVWTAAGYRVGAQAVAGPAFWQTTEIVELPELLKATVSAVEGGQR